MKHQSKKAIAEQVKMMKVANVLALLNDGKERESIELAKYYGFTPVQFGIISRYENETFDPSKRVQFYGKILKDINVK